MYRVLITGAAGFIGYNLAQRLIHEGYEVVGIDNLNEYYDVNLKLMRLSRLHNAVNFEFVKGDICDAQFLVELFERFEFDIVINLAAQVGVRYSLKEPIEYINTNIVGYVNLMEMCKNKNVKHFLYASSSSVYGANTEVPYNINCSTEKPLSLYAASKKTNELIAYTYSHLYGIPTTGLRFFTVYGPWGRPDMAYFSFAVDIVKGKAIKLFNRGAMERDFTFIDDVVECIVRLINKPYERTCALAPSGKYEEHCPYQIFNIGSSKMISLDSLVTTVELCLGKKAKKEYVDMQKGDVLKTYADTSNLIKKIHYSPDTEFNVGIAKFVAWLKEYYL